MPSHIICQDKTLIRQMPAYVTHKTIDINLFYSCSLYFGQLRSQGFSLFVIGKANLVPRACDPWEGNEGSGIIRFREESDWPLKWMRSSILARILGFR